MSTAPTFRLQFLGTGDTFCNGGRANPSLYCATADSAFLVDCGPTTIYQAKRLGVDLNTVDAVFITHVHGDHTLALPMLTLEMQFVWPRTRPLTLFGPPGFKGVPEGVMELVFPDTVRKGFPFELKVREMVPGDPPIEIAGMRVQSFEMNHSLPAVGYRFEREGVSFACAGDTRPCAGLVEMARGTDLLVTECSFPDPIPEIAHTSHKELLDLAPSLETRRIVVVHTNSAFDPVPFEAPEDGDVIEV